MAAMKHVKVRYVGHHDEVEVTDGDIARVCAHGAVIEVSPELAHGRKPTHTADELDAFRAAAGPLFEYPDGYDCGTSGLLAQTDAWELADDAKPSSSSSSSTQEASTR